MSRVKYRWPGRVFWAEAKGQRKGPDIRKHRKCASCPFIVYVQLTKAKEGRCKEQGRRLDGRHAASLWSHGSLRVPAMWQ